MSALESLAFFFLFLSFLSFFPLLVRAEAVEGEGTERYREDWISGFWMSTVAMRNEPGLPGDAIISDIHSVLFHVLAPMANVWFFLKDLSGYESCTPFSDGTGGREPLSTGNKKGSENKYVCS